MFREGPIGGRATLVGGPDVWPVIQAVRSGGAEPGLDEAALLEMISDNTGVPLRLVRTAVDYWADYPHEVEALLTHADRRATELAEADRRKRGLLGREAAARRDDQPDGRGCACGRGAIDYRARVGQTS